MKFVGSPPVSLFGFRIRFSLKINPVGRSLKEDENKNNFVQKGACFFIKTCYDVRTQLKTNEGLITLRTKQGELK